MIRRPPRSTLFPYTSSSDLCKKPPPFQTTDIGPGGKCRDPILSNSSASSGIGPEHRPASTTRARARAHKIVAEKPVCRTLARWGEQYRGPGCLNPRPEPEVG